MTRLRIPCSPQETGDTRYLFLLIRFKSLSLFNISFFRRKRMQRYNHFPFHQNIFSNFLHPTTSLRCQSAVYTTKNFSPTPPRGPAKAPVAPQKAAFFDPKTANRRNRRQKQPHITVRQRDKPSRRGLLRPVWGSLYKQSPVRPPPPHPLPYPSGPCTIVVLLLYYRCTIENIRTIVQR